MSLDSCGLDKRESRKNRERFPPYGLHSLYGLTALIPGKPQLEIILQKRSGVCGLEVQGCSLRLLPGITEAWRQSKCHQ